ncbi:hypothetical protein ACPTHA_14070 [Enterococcus faecalis]|jgi:hypothetical protein|uniref:hypothetical protein n=1 Tax=Enterococcus TaxID=1350 RepID=UPI0017E244C3|nr:hypothetical protein [Enterococcus faecalis]EGO8565241.1 hypothetical protein [Enterococcus faecalis]EGO8625382.1 hypothetical protein [Enterococcus faecalis]MBA1329250.1 hypothetical protein [Enterococcus faecalis]MCU9780875.1 hypothetical protein [Enterococcus faecalis]MDU4291840.1 hypothetical protein [Enterococcus faecalis]
MKNYWFVSLTSKYPPPNHSLDASCVVISVRIKKNASIVETMRESTTKEIDAVYYGVGCWEDKHIQENIKKYVR